MIKTTGDGTILYFNSSELHRLDGPAVEIPKNTPAYCNVIRKLRIRSDNRDNRAQMKSSGIYFYYLDGNPLTFDSWSNEIENICGGSHATFVKLKWGGA